MRGDGGIRAEGPRDRRVRGGRGEGVGLWLGVKLHM